MHVHTSKSIKRILVQFLLMNWPSLEEVLMYNTYILNQ